LAGFSSILVVAAESAPPSAQRCPGCEPSSVREPVCAQLEEPGVIATSRFAVVLAVGYALLLNAYCYFNFPPSLGRVFGRNAEAAHARIPVAPYPPDRGRSGGRNARTRILRMAIRGDLTLLETAAALRQVGVVDELPPFGWHVSPYDPIALCQQVLNAVARQEDDFEDDFEIEEIEDALCRLEAELHLLQGQKHVELPRLPPRIIMDLIPRRRPL
jgi:hypothetical protein